MAMTREDVLKVAMELSESDRLLLATELMETVSDNPPMWLIDDPKLRTELESRANDGSPTIPWETVKAQLSTDLQA